MLSGVEARVLGAVDGAAAAPLLAELVIVPSVTGSDAESALQHRLAGDLERLGLDVDLWSLDLPALRATAGFPGTEAPRTEGWGLVGTGVGAGDGPSLVLQGHVDVVPPGDVTRWPGAPFTPLRRGDVVHGRGTCDMKGGVVSVLLAVRALRDAGVRLRGDLAVHLVVGEEDGGLGAFGTLARGHRGDACVIAEPTTGRLVTAAAGALTFRLEVPGLGTHGSTRYAGVSALDAYLPLHAALARLESRRNTCVDPLMAAYPVPYPLSVGTVAAGDWASSVPDLLVAEGRLGVRLDEDPADARAALAEAVADACAADPWLRDHPARLTWPGGQFAPGRLPLGHPWADLVAGAHADVTGAPPPAAVGVPYGSDLRLYAQAGVPTVHLGPGDAALAHGPREAVPLAEVVAVARTLALVALRRCGTA